jgi:hypothetical protein
MEAIKTPKKAIKLIGIAADDWAFIKNITTLFVAEAITLEDILVATILSELILEKHSTPYTNLLPVSIKLKNYQIVALYRLLTKYEYNYYSPIGRRLIDLFLQVLPAKIKTTAIFVS